MIKDDMVFVPYDMCTGGYQCKMKVSTGTISVRYKGNGLIVDEKRPYEVWYPDDEGPTGYQTAEDIWRYINQIAECNISTS